MHQYADVTDFVDVVAVDFDVIDVCGERCNAELKRIDVRLIGRDSHLKRRAAESAENRFCISFSAFSATLRF
jgi:hypothetical protein